MSGPLRLPWKMSSRGKRKAAGYGWILAAAFLSMAFLLSGCGKKQPSAAAWSGMEPVGSMDLSYARQFSVDRYEGGFRLISIEDGSRYLVVPEGREVPDGLDEEIVVLRQPLERIYLVATSAMDLFCSLDGLDQIRLSGTREEDWHIEEARRAMEEGKILYAGKYSAPDYEQIYGEGCDLAVESTMM